VIDPVPATSCQIPAVRTRRRLLPLVVWVQVLVCGDAAQPVEMLVEVLSYAMVLPACARSGEGNAREKIRRSGR
jgi:hypothetical protein